MSTGEMVGYRKDQPNGVFRPLRVVDGIVERLVEGPGSSPAPAAAPLPQDERAASAPPGVLPASAEAVPTLVPSRSAGCSDKFVVDAVAEAAVVWAELVVAPGEPVVPRQALSGGRCTTSNA